MPFTKVVFGKLVAKHGKKMLSSTVSSYRSYFDEKTEEQGFRPALYDRRMAQEAFAELTRMRVSDRAEFRKQPKPLRDFVNKTLQKTRFSHKRPVRWITTRAGFRVPIFDK